MKSIGLLSGIGRLPIEVAKAAKKMGISVYAVGLVDGVEADLAKEVTDYKAISIAQLGSIIEYLKSNNVTDVIMIGKVTKEILFTGQHALPDARMLALLASLKDHSDDTMMLAFVKELAKEGIQTFDQTMLLKMIMPKPGVLTKRQPTQQEKEDMEFGFKMAKALGGLDIGQTVVVKNKAVMALEAIEGTDACILRGGKLACGGAVVAKVAKPAQDNRFDMPAVGIKTIETMIEGNASALVIEAGRTLLVDREKALDLADKHDITIVVM
ncbi:MAG TPA: UDP-2,3-diacylglucosamine diphosphatase LpxI [Megamonas hypermegale]|uniref:LpxI family protein n=1 Tax=Megamonas hypermegale TaxID=158847 RepID=UPI001D7B3182|nr:UDP-2,3-diacylglucosamine diphosphatase LpxI [Megamonas hypermegale]HJG06683.1 UDP-2,3-diacylglucosamine diphosphatase LpxI [Megamonas hypermegale]